MRHFPPPRPAGSDHFFSHRVLSSAITWVALAVIASGWIWEGYYALVLRRSPQARSDAFFSLFDSGQALTDWFETSALLLAALLALLAAQHRLGRERRLWLSLTTVMVFLSLDEFSNITHDYSHHVFYMWTGQSDPVIWVGAVAAICVGAALLHLPLLRTIPKPYSTRLFWAAVVFIGGAVGGELVSTAIWVTHGYNSIGYIIAAGLEETAEVAGITLHVRTMLAFLERRATAAAIHLEVTNR